LRQRKYTMDLLKETKMENCRSIKLPLTPNLNLFVDSGQPLADPNKFRRLVGKLIHLSITRPSFAVQLLSQFMSYPTGAHMQEAFHVLRYLKATSAYGILLMLHPYLTAFYPLFDPLFSWFSCRVLRGKGQICLFRFIMYLFDWFSCFLGVLPKR